MILPQRRLSLLSDTKKAVKKLFGKGKANQNEYMESLEKLKISERVKEPITLIRKNISDSKKRSKELLNQLDRNKESYKKTLSENVSAGKKGYKHMTDKVKKTVAKSGQEIQSFRSMLKLKMQLPGKMYQSFLQKLEENNVKRKFRSFRNLFIFSVFSIIFVYAAGKAAPNAVANVYLELDRRKRDHENETTTATRTGN